MATSQTASTSGEGVCHIINLPPEIDQKIFTTSLPNFKVQIFKFELEDNSGEITTRVVLRAINMNEWDAYTQARHASDDMEDFVEGGISAGVSSGQIAIQPDVLWHANGGEPYPTDKKDFYHGTLNHNLPDGFLDVGMLASGQTFKHLVMYLPFCIVDISAYGEEIKAGQKGREIIEEGIYDDDGSESLRIANFIIKKDNDGRWTAKVLCCEAKTIRAEYDEKNIRRRKLSNGQVKEWDVSQANINTFIVEMHAAIEEHVQKGVGDILPKDASLTFERFVRVQDLLMDSVDGISDFSTMWTTPSLSESLEMLIDEQLHSEDFGSFDVEEKLYEPRSILEAENQRYMRGDDPVASTFDEEDGEGEADQEEDQLEDLPDGNES